MNENRNSILFVAALKPGLAQYGAERSLKYIAHGLRKVCPGCRIDFLIRNPVFPGRRLSQRQQRQIVNFFDLKQSESRFFFRWIPYSNWPFSSRPLVKPLLRHTVSCLLWFVHTRSMRGLIKNYDIIHINNSQLFLFNRGFSATQHIRDYVSRPTALLDSNVLGFVCIDESTRRSLLKNSTRKLRTVSLVNPYATRASTSPTETSAIKPAIPDCADPETTVFAVIGRVVPRKGVDYIIEEFVSAQRTHSELWIVGDTDDAFYYHACRKRAAGQSNIVFTGPIRDIAAVYEKVHVQIRGDKRMAIGRTTIEAAHHGVKSFVPVEDTDPDMLAGLEFHNYQVVAMLRSTLSYYSARKNGALAELIAGFKITELSHEKKNEDTTSSYALRLLKFWDEIYK